MDEEKVRAILAGIAHPAAETNIVEAGMISEVEIDGGEVTVVLHFEGVPREKRHALEDEVRNTLSEAEGVEEVMIEVEVGDLPEPSPPKHEGISMHGGGPAPEPAKPEGALAQVQNIIAVASGKGGVGKSTVAVNLALALKARGARVGVCDIDIYGPSVPIQLNVAGAKPQVSADQKRFLPVEAYGMKVMSIGFLVEDDTPVIWRGPIVGSVVKQFLDDVAWGALDYLVIDLPPGTGDAQLTLSQHAPITGAIIVTTPSELALVDAVKGLQMFRKVDTPVLGMVENMAHYLCPECGHQSAPFNSGGTSRISEQFGVGLLASIPIDHDIQRGGDTGHPIVVEKPSSPHTAAFLELADTVIAKCPYEASEGSKKKGFLSSIFKR